LDYAPFDNSGNTNNSSSDSMGGNTLLDKPLLHKRGSQGSRNNATSRKSRYRGRGRAGGEGDSKGDGKGGGKRKLRRPNQRKEQKKKSSLKPINVSSNSIHSKWKKELGGVIRYYANCCGNGDNIHDTMRHIEKLYIENGCDINQTKNAICHQLENLLGESGECSNDDPKKNYDNWVDIEMAIEIDSIDTSSLATTTDGDDEIVQIHNISYKKTDDKRGILLHKQKMNGEGPTHSHEQWNTVIVPDWAIGKPYFFQISNRSVLHLSYEMCIDADDNLVAKNVPLPRKGCRMVRPDNNRYFQCHKWILQPAKRVKLHHYGADLCNIKEGNEKDDGIEQTNNEIFKKRTKRYNNIRPNYHGNRVNTLHYPDPTRYNWTFTGSNEEGRVEFFEKTLNFGLVKLDFYYTTGTVKTTLVHPTTGPNCLFRNTVNPDVYIQILQNPRVHTNRGYRSRSDRKDDESNNLDMMMDSEDEEGSNLEGVDVGGDGDTNMISDEANNETNSIATEAAPNYARNDNYDFDNEGHINRKEAMAKMEKTKAFSAWEDAAKKEWACIQGKFFVSLPMRSRHHNSKKRHPNSQSATKQKAQKEDLPEQAPVVDIKAAERATLGTKFHAIGPSEQQQSGRRSKVVMKRINGLNESDDCRTAPVFEYKLFYRAEAEITDTDKNSGGEMMDSDFDGEHEISKLQVLDANELSDYRQKRILQVRNWHQSFTFSDNEEAEFVLNNRIFLINGADSVKKIDDVVEEYYQWLQKQQWTRGHV